MVAQLVAAVCDPSVSILDLRNGTGEDNSEGIFSNSQIVDRSDDSERVSQGKGYIPKDIPDGAHAHC